MSDFSSFYPSNSSFVACGKFSCLLTRVWPMLLEGLRSYPIGCQTSHWSDWDCSALQSNCFVFVTFWQGLQRFCRDCFEISRYYLGNSIPTYRYYFSLTNKVSWGDIPFSPMWYLLFPSLILLCRRGEVKIEVIEKFKVRLDLSILSTSLPCQIVTLQNDVWYRPCRRRIRCQKSKTTVVVKKWLRIKILLSL